MDAQRDNRRIRVISFSGIDGAGKSTQIERLRASLEQIGLSVRLVCFWDDVATLTRFREGMAHLVFRGDAGVGTPEAPIRRRDKNVRSWIMTGIRLFLYVADTISLRLLIKRVQRSGVDVLIFDRFIYDELANLELGQSAMRAYARAITNMVPKPDISYLLDSDPNEARARKPEYPLEFLDFNRRSYLTLNNFLGIFQVVAPMAVDDVERETLKIALKDLSLAKPLPAPVPNTEGLSPQTSCVP